MKYIICDNRNVAIFSEVNTHREMASKMYGKVTSAGFCTLGTAIVIETGRSVLKVHCWGSSVSLGIGNNGEVDEKIIERELSGSQIF